MNRRLGLVIGLAAVAAAAGWLVQRPADEVLPVAQPRVSPGPGESRDLAAPKPDARRSAATPRQAPAPAPSVEPLAAPRDEAKTSPASGARSPEPITAASLTPAGPPPASTAAPASAPKPLVTAKIDTRTVVIKKDAVIGIRLDQPITASRARVDDKISATISRDVVVDGVTAIAAGARLEGTVTLVERAPNGREKIGVRFTTLVRADATRLAIQTDTIFRESGLVGDPSVAFDSTSAFGAVLSNGNRAAQRGAARYEAVRLPAGSALTVQLTAPLSLIVGSD